MYCQNCGIYNENNQKKCQVCEAPVLGGKEENQPRIFADLHQVPLKDLLKSLIKVNPVFAVLLVPIIAAIYVVRKAFKKPFLSPLLNSRTQKYRITQIDENSGVKKGSYRAAVSFLQDKGFEPLIDLQDMNVTQVALRKIMFNPEKKIYVTINIPKSTDKVSYVTFHSVTSKKTYVEINNTYGFTIDYPKNCIVKYLPNLTIEAAYNAFLDIFEETGESPVALPLKKLMPVQYKVSRYTIERGLQQGIFKIKTPAKQPRFGQTTTLYMCSSHPLNAAVRKCATCSTPLCEACYTLKNGKYYCDSCLSNVTAEVPPSQPVIKESGSNVAIPEGFHFAGFGVRLIATALDVAIIGLLTTGIFYGVWSITGNGPKTFPFLITQFFLVIFTISYFILMTSKYGLTAGKKIFGLHVINHQGANPDKVASAVRFAYHILSGIFVFPLAGYLFIIFKKNKQGLHDRLAETYVITRHPRIKALFSWCIFVIPLLLGGWFLIQNILTYLNMDFNPEISLDKKWSDTMEDSDNYIYSASVHGNRCVFSTSASLVSIDMQSGKKIWERKEYTNVTIYQMDNKVESLIIEKISYDGNSTLASINPDNGSTLWEHAVDIAAPYVIVDSKSIVLYGDSAVCEFSTDGKLLWKKRFSEADSELTELYAILNRNILVNLFSDSSRSLMYLERNTGKILWEIKDVQYSTGPALANGHQILYSDDGLCSLMYLPDKKTIWKLKENFYFTLQNDPSADNNNLQPYLYSNTAVLNTGDGSTVFNYPEDTRLICLTDQYLIFSPYKAAARFKTPQINMILADKSTGKIKKEFPGTNWLSLAYITEDASDIYLLAENKGEKTVNSILAVINKKTLGLRQIPIGKNIHASSNFIVYPQSGSVFIQTYKDVGLYTIPEKSGGNSPLSESTNPPKAAE